MATGFCLVLLLLGKTSVVYSICAHQDPILSDIDTTIFQNNSRPVIVDYKEAALYAMRTQMVGHPDHLKKIPQQYFPPEKAT